MKKVLFILFFATLSLGSYAQKGMQGVGVSIDGGYIHGESPFNPIISLKYQYYIYDNIRLVPSLLMGLNDYKEISINSFVKADLFLSQISKFRVYASAGIGYAFVKEHQYLVYKYRHEDYKECREYKKNVDMLPHFFSYLFGLGVEWRVAYNWTIQLSGNFVGMAGSTAMEEFPDYISISGNDFYLENRDNVEDYSAEKYGGYLSFGLVYNF